MAIALETDKREVTRWDRTHVQLIGVETECETTPGGGRIPVRIVSIAEHPDVIDIVARWQFAEWGHLEREDSLAARIADLNDQAAKPGQIVSTFVALEGDDPLGCASVVEQTADVVRASPRQRDLSPWRASVYVRPEARGRGVATALVRHTMNHVATMGVARFYLFTVGARGLYERIGWQVIDVDPYAGQDMAIMAIDLTPSPA